MAETPTWRASWSSVNGCLSRASIRRRARSTALVLVGLGDQAAEDGENEMVEQAALQPIDGGMALEAEAHQVRDLPVEVGRQGGVDRALRRQRAPSAVTPRQQRRPGDAQRGAAGFAAGVGDFAVDGVVARGGLEAVRPAGRDQEQSRRAHCHRAFGGEEAARARDHQDKVVDVVVMGLSSSIALEVGAVVRGRVIQSQRCPSCGWCRRWMHIHPIVPAGHECDFCPSAAACNPTLSRAGPGFHP